MTAETQFTVQETSAESLSSASRPSENGAGRRVGRRPLIEVTVADGLMLIIATIAAVARFANLGAQPLSPNEAGAALASWQFTHGAAVTVPVTSPAYFGLTNLVMSLGLDGDTAVRLVPALFGLLTVLAPWLWRGLKQPAVWLTAAIFLAVSPMLLALSRTAGGDAVALFALLLLAIAARRLGEGARWFMIAGAALGLGLTSSPLFYTGLVAALPAWWIFSRTEDVGGEAWRRFGLSAALVFTLLATQLFFFPAGLGAALRLFPEWLSQFGLPLGSNPSALSPVYALMRYEPALLLLGVPAVAWALGLDGRTGKTLAIWLALLLPLILLQSNVLANAAATVLPGYLLVGLLAGSLMAETPWTRRRTTWLTAGGLLLLGMVLLVSVGRFTRLGLWTGGQASLVALATLAFVFAGITVTLALAWDNVAARRGVFLGLAALLLYWQWGVGWQLSHVGANDSRERWITAGTDDDVPVMVQLLTRVSRQISKSDTGLEIFSTADSPVLDWYLRDFDGYRSGPTLPLGTGAAVIITPDDQEPQLPNDYFGADFGLAQRDLASVQPASGLDGAAVAELLRWWLFHESNAPVEQQRVIVWIRSDLATAP